MRKLLIPLAIVPLLAAPPALAELDHLGPLHGHFAYYERHRGENVEVRLEAQRILLGRGVSRGLISREEAGRLGAQQHRIDRAWRVATADGRYTQEERTQVENMLAASVRHIRHAMRDRY